MPAYVPVGWADDPSTASPLDSANLIHMEGGITAALRADGAVTASAATPVSVTLSGSSRVLADWTATDGVHYQMRELSDTFLEVFDVTNSVSLLRMGAGKVWVKPQTAFGSTPSLALTIGDADTGINWSADGHITMYSQGVAIIDMFAGTTINIIGTLQSNGVQVPTLVGGGKKISTQSTAPSSPAVGDVWIDTSISL